jgi:hypothetical protein
MQIRNLKGEVLREVPGNSLKKADLWGANLRGADLRWADLRGADLRVADLRGANLREANLYGTNLRDANLRGVDLREADLREADLSEADLRGATLSGVHLRRSDIRGAALPPSITPSEGAFLAYKKVLQANGTYTVIKLLISADAQRTSALPSRKCRASHVIVVEGEGVSPTTSRSKLNYTPGAIVTADRFDSDRREECTNGIHFFLTREEAEAYQP